jgi:uncharacterized protein YxjI
VTVGLLDRDVVVVKQRAKIVELTNQYTLLDPDGAEIGAIEEVNQSKARKLLRLVSSVDQFLTHTLKVTDADGSTVLTITRPAKLLKSTVEVADGTGAAAGKLVQQNVIGKIRFGLVGPAGEALGELRAENWRAWDFTLVDTAEREVGRVTKQWRGILQEGFTTADTYVLQVEAGLTGPLRLLCFAAAAAVDTALKQDSN